MKAHGALGNETLPRSAGVRRGRDLYGDLLLSLERPQLLLEG